MSILNLLWRYKTPPKAPDDYSSTKPVSAPATDSHAEKAIREAEARLEAARKALEDIDKKIAESLKKFGSAQFPNMTPTLEQIHSIEFPQDIKDLAIETNTPLELFAGVSYFLAIKPEADAIHHSRCRDTHPDYNEEFFELCTHLAARHNTSREVYLSKKAKGDFNDAANARVETFRPKQHDIVVQRMETASMHMDADYNLSPNIIDWIAATNAGWQDMAINGKPSSGPFVEDVTPESQFDVKQPDAWIPVWKAA